MGRKFYILNHSERVFVKEKCTYLEKVNGGWTKKEGMIVIPVDSLDGNQDPYVFYNPWLFGYCKNALLPKEMGEGSGILFGNYHNDHEDSKPQFLLDTIFITNRRFFWVDENGNSPSAEFSLLFPMAKGTKKHEDFIKPRVEGVEHPKAKFIFTSRTFDCKENNNYKLDICENEDYFSCIPLHSGTDGIFKLVDILPVILKLNPDQFKDFNNNPKKLYGIENSMLKDIFNYVLETANVLLLRTEGEGSPEELDIELQRTYYKAVYNEADVKKIDKKCKKVCRITGIDKESKDSKMNKIIL